MLISDLDYLDSDLEDDLMDLHGGDQPLAVSSASATTTGSNSSISIVTWANTGGITVPGFQSNFALSVTNASVVTSGTSTLNVTSITIA